MKILLIDDDPTILKLLVRQFTSLGIHDVTPVDSARAASSELGRAEKNFDLILSDLKLPGMDGVELVRDLAAQGFQGTLVLLSGEDQAILRAAQQLAIAHGLRVTEPLVKPISTEALRHRLEAAPRTNATPASSPMGPSPNAEGLKPAMDRGELINYYQPQIALDNGKLVGVEALVRWRHPDYGLLLPDWFVPLAEDHGMIDELTHAVLIDALYDLREWQRSGLDLRLSVNISMTNLSSLDFPDRIQQAAAQVGVPLDRLTLEVTESQFAPDSRRVLDILGRLRLLGVELSIDDFGTGYSSLIQLRDLPFQELKIDRSFVQRTPDVDDSSQTLVHSTLEMARKLRMRTVAEGIEVPAQLDFLRAHGCDLAQGYLIAHPMRAEALPAWVDARPPWTRVTPAAPALDPDSIDRFALWVPEATESLVQRSELGHRDERLPFDRGGPFPWRASIERMLKCLGAALEFDEPELFLRQVCRLRDFTTARGLPPEDVTCMLRWLEAFYRERLGPVTSTRISAMLIQAQRVLEARDDAAPDDIVRQDPAVAWADSTNLCERLLQGASHAASEILRDHMTRGATEREIEVHLIQPALKAIESDWQANRISLIQAHLAHTAMHRVLAARALAQPAAPPNGRKALLACVAENQYTLGLELVSHRLEQEGWEVYCTGGNTPTWALLEELSEWQPDWVGLFAAFPDHLVTLRDAIRAIHNLRNPPRLRIMIGGLAVRQFPTIAERIGADYILDRASDVTSIAQRLKEHGEETSSTGASTQTEVSDRPMNPKARWVDRKTGSLPSQGHPST